MCVKLNAWKLFKRKSLKTGALQSFVAYRVSNIRVNVSTVCHLKASQQQQRCPMSAVCYEGGVGGRSRAGLRLSLNRSISEPGPATPITVSTPTTSKRFRLEPLPSLPASLPASPNSDGGTNLRSALVLNKVCIAFR